MSHHYSGPDWAFPHGDARLDLTDLYAFPKPGDAGKSILIMNVHPSVHDFLDRENPLGATTADPFILPQLQERVRHVRVFPFEQARAALDDRDVAAEAPYRLREFEADVAAAEDDEVAGQTFQVQRLDVGHRPGDREPRDVGDRR